MSTLTPQPWPTLAGKFPGSWPSQETPKEAQASVMDIFCQGRRSGWNSAVREIERQRQELQPGPASEPDTEDVLALAAIIREVNGSKRLGAAPLAEAILTHPASRWQSVAPPDRDDFIDAAWSDMTPAEAVEGLERLADDQWVPPTK